MRKWEMKIARGFDPKTQSKIGLFASQLDDQLVRLKKEVKDLTVKQLQWQPKPGMNTIGMLLAHLALAEIYWFKVAPKELKWDPEGKKIVFKVCGFEDDGIPLPKKGGHPSYLKGYSADKYLLILSKGRRLIKTEMKKWRDKDLDKLYALGKKFQASRTATAYHVLEHFCSHFGQILMLKHMMRDVKVLKEQKSK